MNTQEILTLTIVLAALFAYINFRFIKWPPVIGIAALSILSSILLITLGHSRFTLSKKVVELATSVDFQDLLMNFMLSFLLFAGAIHIDAGSLRKERWPVIMLATVGIVLSTFLIAGLTWYVFGLFGQAIPFIHCLLFGALISPTDPIAVLSILRKAGIPASLELKISGESLFNDGVAVVVFMSILEVARPGSSISPLSISRLFLQEAFGGILFGAVLGYIGYWALRSIDDYKVEVLITLAIVMGGYNAAGHLHVSGPLAMVVAGIITGNKVRTEVLSDLTKDYLNKTWEMIDEVLNAVLFLFIGLEMLIIQLDRIVLLIGVVSIITCLLARWISVSIPIFLLRYKIKFEKHSIAILTWGGLRGGISIAMALSLGSDMHRNEFVTITYVIVVFSILVQGLTIGRVARKLQQ
ncbi:MAG TPA: sodium:proton antiporter [Puia sp.]|jgi:CPA1 family monovalent cation:H+ antiporter